MKNFNEVQEPPLVPTDVAALQPLDTAINKLGNNRLDMLRLEHHHLNNEVGAYEKGIKKSFFKLGDEKYHKTMAKRAQAAVVLKNAYPDTMTSIVQYHKNLASGISSVRNAHSAVMKVKPKTLGVRRLAWKFGKPTRRGRGFLSNGGISQNLGSYDKKRKSASPHERVFDGGRKTKRKRKRKRKRKTKRKRKRKRKTKRKR